MLQRHDVGGTVANPAAGPTSAALRPCVEPIRIERLIGAGILAKELESFNREWWEVVAELQADRIAVGERAQRNLRFAADTRIVEHLRTVDQHAKTVIMKDAVTARVSNELCGRTAGVAFAVVDGFA